MYKKAWRTCELFGFADINLLLFFPLLFLPFSLPSPLSYWCDPGPEILLPCQRDVTSHLYCGQYLLSSTGERPRFPHILVVIPEPRGGLVAWQAKAVPLSNPKSCHAVASPQTSVGVRLSRIHFSPTSPISTPWGRNECVTNEPQRTSAGRLATLRVIFPRLTRGLFNLLFFGVKRLT